MSDTDMKPTESDTTPSPSTDFSDDEKPISLVREFYLFLTENKKWWMVPLIAFFLILMAAVVMTNSPLAPFIYSLL